MPRKSTKELRWPVFASWWDDEDFTLAAVNPISEMDTSQCEEYYYIR